MADIYIPSGSFESEKMKILAEEKDKAWRGIPKVAGALMHDADPYPTPYLNLSDYQLPKTMVEIFRWCRYFYKFDSLVGAAVNTMARFPVTDILFEEAPAYDNGPLNHTDSPLLGMYKEVFDDLRIADELIKIGIDYWLYGNCFVFGEFSNFSPDPAVPDIRWTKIFRLDPSKITIELNPLTQEKTFKWDIPAKLKKIVKDRKPIDVYDKLPDMIKKAAKANKPVILNKTNIYHFSREGESGDGSVWGTPLILNVMKQLAYRNLLRQAQEAIAREHIVPFRIYYLNPTDRFDPAADWNNVAKNFGAQLEQSAKDPNYKVVSPIPVNVLTMGGQGRALMLTPELEQLQGEILAGMGVPREFIFGGVSYSAASISLRTLENQFINYRSMLEDFLNNFLIKRMAEARGEYTGPQDSPGLVTVRFTDLKMQDDVQQKQMVINMNAGGKVSDEYMYNMLGMDPVKMKAQLEVETFERMERERRMQIFQLETQFAIQQQQMQMDAQLAPMAMNMGLMPSPVAGPNGPATQGPLPPPPEENPEEAPKEKPKDKPKDKQKKEAYYSGGITKIAMPQSQIDQLDIVIESLAKLGESDRSGFLKNLSAEVRDAIYEKLAAANPNTVGNSEKRNVMLWNMSEMDKMKHQRNVMQNAANKTMQHNTENAMMPHSQILPERRDTMK